MTPQELQAWRAAHGYSQSQLARLLNVHVNTISKWENADRAIPPYLHLALSGILATKGETAST